MLFQKKEQKPDDETSKDAVTKEVLEQDDDIVRGNWIEARHGKLLLSVSTMRTRDRMETADPVRIDTEKVVPGIRMFVAGRDAVMTASQNWMG